MTSGTRHAIAGAVLPLLMCLLVRVPAAGQAGAEQDSQVSDTVFRNVRVLTGIPADEFMDTMGMFAAALGYDCSSCHHPDIFTDRDAFAISTPTIERARQMIVMMNALNRTYFDGAQRVSCFTCHRGQYTPEVVPSLALQYGELIDDPSAMDVFPDRRTSAETLFETYVQALGGATRLAELTSFAASGTYSGFNTGGANVPVEIFARSPDQRTQIVRTIDGTGVRVYDGRTGWVSEEGSPVPLMTLTGGNLAGARLDAIVSFPAGIQEAFSEWTASRTTIDGQPLRIAQGRNAGQTPVNFYFEESGLLVRVVRWNQTAVGTVPTQIDYAEYREVAGVQMPFRTTVTWTEGQNTIELDEVRPNVAIDASRFVRPAPFQSR